MKWSKKQIDVNELPNIINQLLMAIKNGDDKIERMRCVYKAEDSSVLTMLMPYDFIDLNPKPKIKEFYIYQVLDP